MHIYLYIRDHAGCQFYSEILYEDEAFPHRQLAALVLSKIYFNLGEYDEALNFALGAGDLFNLHENSLYTKTVVNTAIERYIAQRVQQWEHDANPKQAEPVTPMNPHLEAVVENMFERCFAQKDYNMAIGVALEARRLDILEKALKQGNRAELHRYVQDACFPLLQSNGFRSKVLRLLLELQLDRQQPDYEAICQCLMFLNEPHTCADLLLRLVKNGGEDDCLVVYQVAFDLEANATQGFLVKLIQRLEADMPSSSAEAEGDTTMETSPANMTLANLITILSGKLTIKLYLDFLFRNNRTDLAILKITRDRLESRNSVYHSALTFANAFMHAGTTVDDFLRNSMEWLQRATNWTKFSAAAALGVIHKGQHERALSLMSRYLPQDGVSSSPYSEGGAFFALGLINVNRGGSVVEYLTNALTRFQTRDADILRHGACLGLGAAAMATTNTTLFESLSDVLFSDSAVASEAAGIAMGMVMLGTGSTSSVQEMLQYAHDTQHEKIIRGLAMGMAMIMYGRQEEADILINELCEDKDPLLRYGAMYTIAMAYCGTGSNRAIKRLLHVAVSDVNDEVRRAAVTALGFILFRTPHQVPRMVQLLTESYNPHVRYGATLALGISCAGTGSREAIALLEPMVKDSVDFVRQGALIALALILVQQSEALNSKVASTRKLFESVIGDKHADPMAKFGAVLAQGIIDAGGRNVTVSLQTPSGQPRMPAVVGMCLFTQFWFWYPLTHFLSLAFTPTGFIGLDKNLQVPKMTVVSQAKPSLFAYPEPQQAATTDETVKVATAVLSTTAKAKARAKKAEREKKQQTDNKAMDVEKPTKSGDAMDTDEPKESTPAPGTPGPNDDSAMAVDSSELSESTSAKTPEPKSQTLGNLSRVVPEQWPFITIPTDSRYTPVKKALLGGILMLHDHQPDQPQELMESLVKKGNESSSSSHSSEVKPPKPFEYPFDNDT
ncbi:proteasome regulatory particle base subunit [Dispira simplex]|nr:proteasome regulatory particle base subunit [Dispira simplex]